MQTPQPHQNLGVVAPTPRTDAPAINDSIVSFTRRQTGLCESRHVVYLSKDQSHTEQKYKN